MHNLSLILNQKYRSFNDGFTISLDGNPVVLSGVNGSGKSQILNMIAQRDGQNRSEPINAVVKKNGVEITLSDILRRTFKDNVSIPELTHASTQNVVQHKAQCWNAYRNYLLNHLSHHLWDFKESSVRAKRILIEKYGEPKFTSKQISEKELNNSLPIDFIWKSDDIFTNFIGDIFFNYAIEVVDAKVLAGETGVKFDPSLLSIPPWEELNNLFLELGFEYRFKDNYFIKSYQISEQPSLYQIAEDGSIDENEPRKISDLSDGEKAIISLSFASLSGVKQEDRKVLLLDEFDATFNPSLTKIFYKILEKYFISQGIQVIIATHSPVTISMAPENALFYEVFKSSPNLAERILPVERNNYAELRMVNEDFYGKLSDQESRIRELESEKTAKDEKIEELSSQSSPLLFVEGDTDVEYIKKAADFFPKWKTILDKFKLEEKGGKGNLSKYFKSRDQLKEFLKHPMVLLFDDDANQQEYDHVPIFKRSISGVDENSVKRGIENLFSDELIIGAERSIGERCAVKSIPDKDNEEVQIWKVIDNKKTDLCRWICGNAIKSDFSKFEVIFEKIEAILNT